MRLCGDQRVWRPVGRGGGRGRGRGRMEGDGIEEALLLERREKEDEEEVRRSCGDLFGDAVEENKKLWCLAGPAIFTSIAQYSLGAITQVFAGHLSTLDLDAASIVNLVIAGMAFGIMMGMGSALETLCGQAFGAKQLHMLGVYLQRSWVILTMTSLFVLPLYLWATPILCLLGEDHEIAEVSGTFSLYMIPQLLSFAFNFPMQKFLQAQSKVLAMALVNAIALVIHVVLSWVLIVYLRMGLVGAAISLNLAWWLAVVGQFLYILRGSCPGAWTGFTKGAFKDLLPFAKLSVGSALMQCLEVWYYTLLVVLAGRMRDPQVAVAAFSICINLSLWQTMVFIGFNAAISVRISNELGARRPRAAKLAVGVVVTISSMIGLVCSLLVLVFKDVYGRPFTNSPEVERAVSSLALLFAFTLLLNSVQNVLTGVAVGAGWQWLVAYVNVGCYYIVGLPLGLLLGWYFDFGVKGIWSGMVAGVFLQTLVLVGIILTTNWKKEAMAANSRIKKWGGSKTTEACQT